jgi:hypothetical protein
MMELTKLSPEDAEKLINTLVRNNVKYVGTLFKTVTEHEKFIPIYASFLKRIYDELLTNEFTEEQAFEIVKTIVAMCPPLRVI